MSTSAIARRDPVLVRLEQARASLAQAKTIQAAKTIADLASAAKVYARQQQLGREAIEYAHAVRVEAMRRLGEILKVTEKRGTKHSRGGGSKGSKREPLLNAPSTLAELGVTKKESATAQALAALPAREFEAVRAGTVSVAKATHDPSRVDHFSSASAEHYTPAAILALVQKVFGDIPDLDPCSNAGTPNVDARAHYTAADNGLCRPWGGRVFLNPPYGREIGEWIAKLRHEWQRQPHDVREILALLPNRPDTAWFNALTANSDDAVFCSLHGRLTFVGSSDPAPFPSLVAYFGPRHDVFAAVFWSLGILWMRPPRDFFVDHLD